MRKSELVREAGAASKQHEESQTTCYCTPSRAMRLSIKNVCLNQNLPNPDEVIKEIEARVGAQMAEVTRSQGRGYALRDFDTMDSSAAYALGWDHSKATESFERAAKAYEAEEMAAWDAAKAAWEASVRAAAKTPIRREAAPALDPASQRTKTKAVVQESTVTQTAGS